MNGTSGDRGHDVLALTLQAAVPLRIAELQQLPPDRRGPQVAAWAAAAVEPIGSRGDALLFGGRRSQAADVLPTSPKDWPRSRSAPAASPSPAPTGAPPTTPAA